MINEMKKKAREAREMFISSRTIIERNIEAFAQRLSKADQKLISHIEFPDVISARTLLPSLYTERMDPEQIALEKEILISKLNQVAAVQTDLIAEANKVLGVSA